MYWAPNMCWRRVTGGAVQGRGGTGACTATGMPTTLLSRLQVQHEPSCWWSGMEWAASTPALPNVPAPRAQWALGPPRTTQDATCSEGGAADVSAQSHVLTLVRLLHQQPVHAAILCHGTSKCEASRLLPTRNATDCLSLRRCPPMPPSAPAPSTGSCYTSEAASSAVVGCMHAPRRRRTAPF